VVSHGIPYMALIYLNDIQKKNTTIHTVFYLRGSRGVMLFVACTLIAFCEEYFGNPGLERSVCRFS
jgi:hypothetical protein